MPILSQTLASLLNGVSQQPDAMRSPSQCELLENAYPTIAGGNAKRPPTEHIKQLSSTNLGSATDVFVDFLDMGTSGKYAVTISNSTLRIFDLADGAEKTVTYTAGGYGSYLIATTQATSFKTTRVEDYALLLNTAISPTSMGLVATPGPYDGNIVYVRQGNYSTVYKIVVTLNGTTYTATKTTSDTAISDIRTEVIATALTTFAPALPATITATREESVLYIRYTPSGTTYTDFKVQISDSQGNTAMTNTRDTAQRFTDLPPVAPSPYSAVRIVGEDGTLANPYYVQFVPDVTGNAFGKGTWVECANQGGRHVTAHSNTFNAEKMPHKLVRNTDGTWTLSTGAWGARGAGDTAIGSAPFPAFITGTGSFAAGTPITDLFIYKNRLGLISKNAVTFSRHGQFLELFPSTVTTLLDTSPIEFKIDKNPVIQHAVPFTSGLILCSDTSQFLLPDDGLLTPKTAAASLITEFAMSATVRPVQLGNNFYFPSQRGSFAALNEYYIDDVNGTADAAEVSQHVQKYIAGNLYALTGSTTEDLVVCASATDKAVLYAYKFYWSGNDKLQSSWGKWTLSGSPTILGVKLYNSVMYLVVQRGANGTHLEKVQFDQGLVDSGGDYCTLLDRKITNTSTGFVVSYSAITDLTTWTVPYTITGTMKVVIASGQTNAGRNIVLTSQAGTSITALGNYSTTQVVIGETYSHQMRLSKLFLRRSNQGGAETVVTNGRLQLHFMRLLVSDSKYFRVEVTPLYRSTITHVFTGRPTGAMITGTSTAVDTEFRFGIHSKNDQVQIDIINDSHFQCRFLSAEWEGLYSPKASRS